MAQFTSFAPGVEVNGQTVLAFTDAIPAGREFRLDILKKHGIEPVAGSWFPQQAWLDAFREVAETIGNKTLFAIGKAIIDHAEFPPMIQDLQTALGSIDMAYHMNHRGGDIGHYTLLAFDADAHEAVMECNNPYPSEFDRGIITSLVRRFKPDPSSREFVELDATKPTRLSGGESCTYIIRW